MSDEFKGFKIKAVSDRRRSFACWNEPNARDNPLPSGRLRVIDGRMLNEEMQQLLLVVQDEKGEVTDCPLFPRDLAKCTSEWGEIPSDWREVMFEKFGKRYRLVPCKEKLVEQVI